MKLFEKQEEKFLVYEYEQKCLLNLVEDFTFFSTLKHFSFSDKVELIKCLKIKKVTAGTRFFGNTDRIDSFNLLMKGKVGVFYPEL